MSTTAPAATEHVEVITDPRRRNVVLAAMCIALVAVVSSVSGLNVAMQVLAEDLGASQGDLLWIINGYTIALAALLLPLGAVGDRWGRKWLLVAGLGVFIAANFAAAFATGATAMLIARIVAGTGAALIMPVTLSTVTTTFPAEERAKAIGIWSGFAGAGGIIGLFLSSFVVDNLTWPWVFAMPIVMAGISLALTLAVVDNSREHHEGRFDVVGSILSAIGIGALVLGIHEGPEKGWSDPLAMFGVIVGLGAIVAFVLWELRQTHPLFNVRLFSNRGLAAGSVTLVVVFGVLTGIFLVLMQFLQAVLGYSALKGAASLLPMAFVMMGFSTTAPLIAQRIGTRKVLIGGLATFTVGLALFASMASATGGYWSVLPGLMVLGIGLGMSMTPATTVITGSLPEADQGVASALNDTVRELGGALGVALLGSVLNAGYRAGVGDLASVLPPEAYEPVRDGIGGAIVVAGSPDLPPAASEQIVATARDAFVEGWKQSIWVGVGLAAAALVFVILRGPRDADLVVPTTDVDTDVDTDAEVAADDGALVAPGLAAVAGRADEAPALV